MKNRYKIILMIKATVHSAKMIVRYRVLLAACFDLKGVPDYLMYMTKREIVNHAVTTLKVEISIMSKALAVSSL